MYTIEKRGKRTNPDYFFIDDDTGKEKELTKCEVIKALLKHPILRDLNTKRIFSDTNFLNI